MKSTFQLPKMAIIIAMILTQLIRTYYTEVTRLGRFDEALYSDKFVITAELNPPKGTDLNRLYEKADLLKDMVAAFNVTDSAGSIMSMAPIAVSHLLQDQGIDTILQITGRDRNKIALQSELLAASALGVTNILCMSGDPPGAGDHPDAKAVGDLDALGLLRAARCLNMGKDLAGAEIKGSPTFFPGAVANPGALDMDTELKRMEGKVKAGAAFFQTQAVYETSKFEQFMSVARQFGVPVLAGLIILKSAKMAHNLNANLPGVTVPDEFITLLDNSEDRSATSVEIIAKIIRDIQGMCNGVHIMAIGWESKIPQILAAAGV